MYSIRFYLTPRGDCPVDGFLEGCDKSIRAKYLEIISLLRERGPVLKRPYADKVEGKIYELRIKQARILYFFGSNRQIVLAHGFLKKRDELDKTDIEIAERRRHDWLLRVSFQEE